MVVAGEERAREKETSQWREILAAGVDGWSSFSDTCSDEPDFDGATKGGTDVDRDVQQHQHHHRRHHQKEKSYPSLDLNWKQERRDVEWQCFWLELRLKELQSHKKRYERKLKSLDKNAAGGQNGGSERQSKTKSKNGKLARMVLFNDHPLFDPIRRRREKILKKRTLVTSGEEKDGEDAKRTEDEDGKSNKKAKTEENDNNSKENKANKSGSGGDSDVSNTVMHEKCEDLKKRCLGLMQRLGQPPPIFTSTPGGGGGKGGKGGSGGGGVGRGSRNGRNRNKNYPYGGSNAGGGPGKDGSNDNNNNNTTNAETGNNNARKHTMRKADEYDINNVVGNVIRAKYVERALHEDINTPSVREVTTFTMSAEEMRRANNVDSAAVATTNNDNDDSSDEDISDEAFAARHAKYEILERNARMPLELLKKAKREKNGGKSPKGRKGKPSLASNKSNSGNEDEKQATQPVKRTVDLNALHASDPVVVSKKRVTRASESNSDSPSDGSAELNEDIVREILLA